MAGNSPYQLQVRGTDELRAYSLREGVTTIGRSPESDLRLKGATVSDRHAEITYHLATAEQPGRLTLTDLGSTNGTRLQTKPIPPYFATPLRPGSTIQIGGYTLTVELYLQPPAGPVRREVAAPAQGSQRLAPYPYSGQIPFGLSQYSRHWLPYLPDIYQPSPAALQIISEGQLNGEGGQDQARETFLARFLGLFESIFLPIESMVEHFDLYLDPKSTPQPFLPWLEHLFGLPFFTNLTELQKHELSLTLSSKQRRQLVEKAYELVERKGTKKGLQMFLELLTQNDAGSNPVIEINDLQTNGAHFVVQITPKRTERESATIEALIEAYKPVHTTYELK